MTKPEYQYNLSLQSPILLDYKYKRPKIMKMLSVLSAAGMITDSKKQLALDIGCSGGFFTTAIAPYFDTVIGFDIDMNALSSAHKTKSQSNVHYLSADSLNIPFQDNSVDLVICNHVYEHVPNPGQMFQDIYRILKQDGICYLGAASRLTLVEPHYHLPFLSWLPKPIAHRYLRFCNKGDLYYENLRTYAGIKNLVTQFSVEDFTLKIIADPDAFNARDLIPKNGITSFIPLFIWKTLYKLLPTYILILRKE